MGRFKEHMLQECEVWDALVHGVKKGYNAFKEKRKEQQEQSGKKDLENKILTFKNKDELKALVKQIVASGYTLEKGELKEEPKTRPINGWLIEDVQSLFKHHNEQDRQIGSGEIVRVKAGELVGHTHNSTHQQRRSREVV